MDLSKMKKLIQESEIKNTDLKKFSEITILGNPDISEDKISVQYYDCESDDFQLEIQAKDFSEPDNLNKILTYVVEARNK